MRKILERRHLQHTSRCNATYYNVLQHTATRTATYCNTHCTSGRSRVVRARSWSIGIAEEVVDGFRLSIAKRCKILRTDSGCSRTIGSASLGASPWSAAAVNCPVYVCACVYVYECKCKYIHFFMHIHIYVYVYMYVLYIHICIYLCIHIDKSSR